jgi:tetratricopeptide (TPR) repeat protein
MCYALLLSAGEIDDLKFAAGLFADGNDKLAESELINFLENYPNSKFENDAKYLLSGSFLRQKKYAEANMLLQDLYRQNYNPALQSDILLSLAQSYFYLEDYSNATKYFLQFKKEFLYHDQISEALYFLGKIEEQKGDNEAALEYYIDAYEVANTDKTKLLAAQLRINILLNNHKQADQLFEKILREGKGERRDYAIILWLEAKIADNDYDQVLEKAIRKIRQDSPYFAKYKMLLGICCYHTGKMQKARDYLVGLADEKAEYYYALANKDFDPNKASEIFKRLQNSMIEEIAINSKFFLIQMENDTDEAIKKLSEFIKENKDSKFWGSAQYLLGYKLFEKGNFQQALIHLKKAEESNLDAETFEKLHYLLAETYYQLDKQELAEKYLESYLQKSANQKFRDQAIFKRALQAYEQKDFLVAINKFIQLENFPNSDKLAVGYFYLGEIYLLQSKNDLAKKYYSKAEKSGFDRNFINLRLAKIAFRDHDFDLAESILKNIPEEEKYLYDAKMLKGNLLAEQKKYSEALINFVSAENFASNNEESEAAISQKAWCLYQLQRFDEASQLYQQLSSETADAKDYILKAANAAFSAEKYQKAIELFERFKANFANDENLEQVQISIADSYYNLGNYQLALENYKLLFTISENREIIKNALAGIRWCTELLGSADLQQELDNLLAMHLSNETDSMILKEKINYLFQNNKWENVIESYQQISALQSLEHNYDASMQAAISLAKIGDLDGAREIFSKLEEIKMTADLYYNWAVLELDAKQKIKAMMLLKKGAAISKRDDIWLTLLELHPLEMNEIYEKYIKFAEPYFAFQAKLIWIDWKLQNKDYNVLEDLEKLKQTKYSDVQAEAQYLLGYRFYLMQEYEKAIRELLRVRYLYPDIYDMKIKAEFLAAICYIYTQEFVQAQELYNSIKDKLDISKRNEFQTKFDKAVSEQK